MMSDQRIETLLTYLCRQRKGSELRDRFSSIHEWEEFFQGVRASWSQPIDQAILGGFESDRLAYAFASGIQSALHSLVPEIVEAGIVSICITEEGGGHPLAIQTSLKPVGNDDNQDWILSGKKKWATLSCDSAMLLVAAVRGIHSDGRKDIVLVKVPTDAEGVNVTPMPSTSFTPEITHGEVSLNSVIAPGSAILPGDGYTRYVKPFRTVEDSFVSAAIAGLMLRIGFAFHWPDDKINQVLQIIAVSRIIATSDPDDASIHVLLQGALAELARLGAVEGSHWNKVAVQTRERWARDIVLAGIAGKAKAKRFERAWERLQDDPREQDAS